VAATNRLTPDRLADEVARLVPATPLVVALGGGADSAVAAWATANTPSVRGVFVRHGLVGSTVLEGAALALGDHLGIDVAVVDAIVQPGSSLEDRARTARWRAISEMLGDGETVVMGHTQDDQAETVLMNLLRGSGGAGVAGMLRSRPGVIRPLLGYSRAELRGIAEELDLPFADDPGNNDLGFLRNRLRVELIPTIERDYQPRLRAVLARAGSLAAMDDRLIEELADEIPISEDAGAVLVPLAPLVTASRPVAARAVRRALRRLLDPYAGSESDIDAVLAVAERRSEAATLSGALAVAREGPYVAIDPGSAATPIPVAITVPASVRFGPDVVTLRRVDVLPPARGSILLVDPAVVGADTVLRTAAKGERIDVDEGSKAIRTVLSERGIPVRRRAGWPVVANGGRIAAIVGVRVAPWARPTTREAVAIERKQDSS
jgi:tRNA(Ile)-lysidine synthase